MTPQQKVMNALGGKISSTDHSRIGVHGIHDCYGAVNGQSVGSPYSSGTGEDYAICGSVGEMEMWVGVVGGME